MRLWYTCSVLACLVLVLSNVTPIIAKRQDVALINQVGLDAKRVHGRSLGHPIEVTPTHQDASGVLIDGERVEEAEVQQRQRLTQFRFTSQGFNFNNWWSDSRWRYRRQGEPYHRLANTIRRIPIDAPGLGSLGFWELEWNPADTPQMVQVRVRISAAVLQMTWGARAAHVGMNLVSLALNWALIFTDEPGDRLQPNHNSQYEVGHALGNTRYGLWVWESGPATPGTRFASSSSYFQRMLMYDRLTLTASRRRPPGPRQRGVLRNTNVNLRRLVFVWTLAVIEEPEESHPPDRQGPRTGSPGHSSNSP